MQDKMTTSRTAGKPAVAAVLAGTASGEERARGTAARTTWRSWIRRPRPLTTRRPATPPPGAATMSGLSTLRVQPDRRSVEPARSAITVLGMGSSRSFRPGELAAWLAGAGFLGLSIETLLVDGSHGYRDLIWTVPGVCTLIAFGAVHSAQRCQASPFERSAYLVVQGGLIAGLVGNTARALDVDSLAWLGFPLGALLWFFGLVLFGIATLRARVVPRYVGRAILLLEPASIATGLALSPLLGLHDHGSYSGALPKAIVLALVARALNSHRSAPR